MRALLALLLTLSPLMAETFLVCAGVESYEDPGISPLKYAVADVTAFADAFRAAGVPDRNITVLTTNETDRRNRPQKFYILRALQACREKAVGDDTLIFFFAGHGMEHNGVAYLLTSDSLREELKDTALAMPVVQSILARFQARNVLFIIDACRNDPDSGRAAADAKLDDDFARGMRPKLAEDRKEATAALLLACDVGQRAWEMPEAEHGAFTNFLLKGLGGEGRAADGSVTLQSLADYVLQAVPAWAARAKREQTPRYENPTGGDFVLVKPGVQATATGEVLVRSEPAGAEILFNGQLIGRTPASVKLPPGEQQLTIRLDGHEDVTVPVNVRANEVLQTPLTKLSPLPGSVVVTTTPAGAKVYVDGRDTGEVTPCVLKLPPGQVNVRVVLDGRESRQEAVTVLGGKTVRLPAWDLPVSLKPAGWPDYLSSFTPPAGMDWSSFRVSAKDGMPQVLIPAGEFTVGSTKAEQEWAYQEAVKALGDGAQRSWFESEGPQKQVTLSAYWMDVHEVTNEQYCRFLNSRQPNEAERKEWVYLVGEQQRNYLEPQLEQRGGRYAPVAGKERYPVIWVTWTGAQAYADWAGRALPTEAQWERAARGGRQTKYVWGDSDTPPAGAGNLCDEKAVARWTDWRAPGKYFPGYNDGYETTSPVCAFRPNGYGLYDLAGNVLEWCRDWYADDWYSKMPSRDPENATQGNARVVRGGSWLSNPGDLRVSNRLRNTPDNRNNNLGFRCAASAPKAAPFRAERRPESAWCESAERVEGSLSPAASGLAGLSPVRRRAL